MWNKLLTYDYSRLAFWFCISGAVLISALFMVIMGFIWMKFTSKKKNHILGYKMRIVCNEDSAWTYVNFTVGRFWLITGIILFFIDTFIMLQCRQGSVEEIVGKALVLMLFELSLMVVCHFGAKRSAKKKFENKSN